jgi:mono/diheme cytochrome c family protein
MTAVLKAFLLFIALAVIVAIAGALYVTNAGVSALETPGPLETYVAGKLRDVAVSRRARGVHNPIERAPEIIAEGRAHFADHCASCHANDGSGNTTMGRGMFPKAPDMRLPRTQNLSDGELFYIIEQGVRFTGMPGWSTGDPDGEAATWHLVHFIRHLPDVSEPELEEMQSLNPAPPDEILQRIEEERFLRGDDTDGQPAGPPASPHGHRH